MTNVIIANILAFCVFFSILMFVCFGGMDLGVGILMPFIKKKDRDIAISSIHPFWDVNETWLIMAAVFLIMGFTGLYGIFIKIFYIPVILLLGVITIRGCALEFFHKNDDHKAAWSMALSVSSMAMVLIFGVFSGNLLNGFDFSIDLNQFNGSFFSLFNPISLVTGIAMVLGFCLIGSIWLACKTEYDLLLCAKKMAKRISYFLIITLLAEIILLFYNQNAVEMILQFSIKLPIIISLFFVGFLSIFACIYLSGKNRPCLALASSFVLVLSGLSTLLTITYPFILPPKIDIFESLRFTSSVHRFETLAIFMFLILVIFLFFFFKHYRVFRGKIKTPLKY
jgi:cytochrome d ubiquinol oxidase subunit II